MTPTSKLPGIVSMMFVVAAAVPIFLTLSVYLPPQPGCPVVETALLNMPPATGGTMVTQT